MYYLISGLLISLICFIFSIIFVYSFILIVDFIERRKANATKKNNKKIL